MSDKPILHARFIEVDGGVLVQIISCDGHIFNRDHKYYPQVEMLLDTACRTPRVNLIPTLNSASAMNDIQQQINEWLEQPKEGEEGWLECFLKGTDEKHYYHPLPNGNITRKRLDGLGTTTHTLKRFNELFEISQSAEVPNFSDDRVVRFEMEGLRVDFALMCGDLKFNYVCNALPNRFVQLLNEFYGEATYITLEHFPLIWQKLQAYKQSQESKPKFRVEWSEVFPVQFTKTVIADSPFYQQGYTDAKNYHENFVNNSLQGIKIHELKVYE